MQSQRIAMRYSSPKGDKVVDFMSKAIQRNDDGNMMYETSWDIVKRNEREICKLVTKGYEFVALIDRSIHSRIR